MVHLNTLLEYFSPYFPLAIEHTVQLKCNVASTRETRASDTWLAHVSHIVGSRITHKALASHSL